MRKNAPSTQGKWILEELNIKRISEMEHLNIMKQIDEYLMRIGYYAKDRVKSNGNGSRSCDR